MLAQKWLMGGGKGKGLLTKVIAQDNVVGNGSGGERSHYNISGMNQCQHCLAIWHGLWDRIKELWVAYEVIRRT